MAFATPVRTSEQSIDRVLRAGLPVVLIFDRHGCPTCQQLDGVIERLAKLFAGRVLLARVDADDNVCCRLDTEVTNPGASSWHG